MDEGAIKLLTFLMMYYYDYDYYHHHHISVRSVSLNCIISLIYISSHNNVSNWLNLNVIVNNAGLNYVIFNMMQYVLHHAWKKVSLMAQNIQTSKYTAK